jgi:D-lactate dehydrogenase
MKLAVYSTNQNEEYYFRKINSRHELLFTNKRLTLQTVSFAKACEAVCCFVTDTLDNLVLKSLVSQGVQLIALRSAGYDYIDLDAAHSLGLVVVRVPEYSPQAVAEFAVGLILSLSRKIPQSIAKLQRQDFSLQGLLGFNLQGKNVGIIGTGHIGTAFARIMQGFGCHLLAYDPYPNAACKQLGVKYVELETLYKQADIISLHCLLNASTHHIINAAALMQMKKGTMLINTGRGALIDTAALIAALDDGRISFAGLDVYEDEKGLYFVDHSTHPVQDEQFLKLQSYPNVVMTGHMAFFTEEAMNNIAKITIANIDAFENKKPTNIL